MALRLPWKRQPDEQPFTPPVDAQGESLEPCQYCSGYHAWACPYVRVIEWEGARVKRVIYHPRFFIDFAKRIEWPE